MDTSQDTWLDHKHSGGSQKSLKSKPSPWITTAAVAAAAVGTTPTPIGERGNTARLVFPPVNVSVKQKAPVLDAHHTTTLSKLSPYLAELYRVGLELTTLGSSSTGTTSSGAAGDLLNPSFESSPSTIGATVSQTTSSTTVPSSSSSSILNGATHQSLVLVNGASNDDVNLTPILPANRKTSRRITKYEKTTLIATRAYDISRGATPTINCGPICDPQYIAMWEYRKRSLPLTIRRILPNRTYEDWSLSELILEED
jgi:DNA-directed RNA polymerase subunit K/omega